MQVPKRFSALPDYPLPRLRRLLYRIPPGGPAKRMSVGDPQHPLPDIVARVVAEVERGLTAVRAAFGRTRVTEKAV